MKKLAALTFAIATATTAFVAPAQAGHKGWYVIMGSFDYRATSAAQRRSNEVQDVTNFSILISSEKFGAIVREANPPRR